MDNSEKMFELADRLKALRDEKKEIEQSLKDINAELEEVDAVLAQLMTDTETQNFTRSGTLFCLTNTTRAAAMADRKEDQYCHYGLVSTKRFFHVFRSMGFTPMCAKSIDI